MPPGQLGYIHVTGVFADGTTTDLTKSTLISYSSHGSVETVDSQGIVTPVAPGPGFVAAKYGNLSVTVPVTVPDPIAIAPRQKDLYASETEQFVAQSTALSPPSIVSAIDPPGLGAIDGTGRYTAPSSISNQQTVTVTATNAADSTQSATATVILFPPMAVTVAPASVNLSSSQTRLFAANVSNTLDTDVIWSISPNNAGSIDDNGWYTAPANVASQQTVTVTATSVMDNATSAAATITLMPAAVQVTVASNVSGPLMTVDGGTAFTGSQVFSWTPGSTHTIAATSPQATGGTQYLWQSWSDGGAISHTVTAPSAAATYTATFNTQYMLTTNVNLPDGGTISPASGWFDANSSVSISATANSPQYIFYNYTGGLTGTNSSQNITMNAPETVTANFTGGVTSLGLSTSGKTGPLNARVWTFSIGNNGPGLAVGAQVSSITFAVQSGQPCTPVVSGLPAMVSGIIQPKALLPASFTIDFTGCNTNTLFKTTTVISANNGNATSTVVKGSQLP